MTGEWIPALAVVLAAAGLAAGVRLTRDAGWKRTWRLDWRAGMGGQPRQLEVLESRALAPGQTLHLVRAPGGTLVVATHSGGCTVLDRIPSSDGGTGGQTR